MIKEAYCSYEVAKLLKEKGFKEPCTGLNKLVIKDGEKPFMKVTHQKAMAWLREEKRTSIIIEFDVTKRGYCPYVYQLDYDMDWVVKWRINMPMKYEEAIEVALKYALEKFI